MRNLNEYITVDESRQGILRPTSKDELKWFIKNKIAERGSNCDLNDIDVSKVKDMSYLFFDSKFTGDISQWDTSKVEDMSFMFDKSEFDGDISNWNVSKVKNMCSMFRDSKFNGDISKWDTSKVKNMSFYVYKLQVQRRYLSVER